jgi:hypothetical protein
MIESARPSPDRLTFEEAWLYCLTLEHNGHHDWRMPSYIERIGLEAYGAWDISCAWWGLHGKEGEMKDKMRVFPVREQI